MKNLLLIILLSYVLLGCEEVELDKDTNPERLVPVCCFDADSVWRIGDAWPATTSMDYMIREIGPEE
tara:strand:- start:47 stop:247 length:201 start_codon:yes stop_codon:yes gene_type:complete